MSKRKPIPTPHELTMPLRFGDRVVIVDESGGAPPDFVGKHGVISYSSGDTDPASHVVSVLLDKLMGRVTILASSVRRIVSPRDGKRRLFVHKQAFHRRMKGAIPIRWTFEEVDDPENWVLMVAEEEE